MTENTKPDIIRALVLGLAMGICFVIYNLWIHAVTMQSVVFAVVFGSWMIYRLLQLKGVSITIPKAVYHWQIIAAVALVTYCYFYATSDILPTAGRKGWFGWWDQSQYLNMARDMSGFDLKSENFFYGVGYPILGALFYGIYPTNPFLVPNLVLYVLTMTLYYRIAGVYLSKESAFIVLLLIMFGTPVTSYFVVPWNNITTLVALAVLVYIAVVVDKIKIWHCVIIGLVIGWVFAARYVDAVFLFPFAGYIFFKAIRENGVRAAKYFLLSALLFIVIVGVVLGTHKRVFGGYFKTPYHKHLSMTDGGDKISAAAFQVKRAPDHLYSVIFNPHQFHPIEYLQFNIPLLGYSFFFVFSLSGFILQICDKKDWLSGIMLGTLIVSFVFYGSFSATRGSDLKYHCLRYFSMWYPAMTIMGVLCVSKLFNFGSIGKRQRRLIYLGISLTFLGLFMNYLYLNYSYASLQKNMLDSSHWSVASNYNQGLTRQAVDRDFATRWDTGMPQKPGMYFQVNFDSIRTLEKIVLNSAASSNDYPRGIKVEVSTGGEKWEEVFRMNGIALPLLTDGSLIIRLTKVEAGKVRIIQTGFDDKANWAISELEIYGH